MKNRRALGALIAAITLAGTLAACSGSGSSQPAASSCSNTISYPNATIVTVWGWYAAEKEVSDLFNKNHKDVQICWTKAGAGTKEYEKLQTALAAGSGAPDVAMLEYDRVNSFAISKSIVDLGPYGAAKSKDLYAPGYWDAVSDGTHTYAVPVDAGPVGLYYRKDLFAKAGITTPPATWDEFAADAAKYAASGAPGSFGNYPANMGQGLMALNAQAGAKPFTYSPAKPKDISIDFNNAATTKVTSYWNDLVQKKLVTHTDLWGTQIAQVVASGQQATFIGAAWAQGYISGLDGQTGKSQWATAPLPQWDANNPVSVNWGGSSFVVTNQAKDKKAAAKVALGMFATDEAVNLDIKAGDVFPTQKSILASADFQNLSPDFYGAPIFKDAFVPAAQAYKGETYSPFAPYLYDQYQAALSNLFKGNGTPEQAIDNLQDKLVAYAKQQGFNVK